MKVTDNAKFNIRLAILVVLWLLSLAIRDGAVDIDSRVSIGLVLIAWYIVWKAIFMEER